MVNGDCASQKENGTRKMSVRPKASLFQVGHRDFRQGIHKSGSCVFHLSTFQEKMVVEP